MKPSAGDQCACTGECRIHPRLRCRETHGAEATWDKGMVALRHVDGVGHCCDRCARSIERRRARDHDLTGDLFASQEST